MKKILFLTIIAALCLLYNGNAMAATASSTLNVTASAAVTCLIGGATLDFGEYTGSGLAASTSFNVQCANGTPYSITYGDGQNYNSGRRMFGGDQQTPGYLEYFITCLDSLSGQGGQECGDGTTYGISSADTGDGTVQSWTIEGQIFGGQFVSAGNYGDSVTITITY